MATHVISTYSDTVDELEDEEKEAMLQAARDYNESLLWNTSRYYPSASETATYNSLLDISDSESGYSVMGSIEIASINVSLPIYHGTSDEVLASGAGHFEGSSLPVGGVGTHAVITGHRGLPSAELFTNLDKLTVGDYFVITVLGEQYTYEVESVNIILPEEMTLLDIDPERDLCSLVTCTPYGVNTHRIVVTGHRTSNKEVLQNQAEAVKIDTKKVALICAIPLLIGLFIWLMIYHRKRKDVNQEDEDEEDEYYDDDDFD